MRIAVWPVRAGPSVAATAGPSPCSGRWHAAGWRGRSRPPGRVRLPAQWKAPRHPRPNSVPLPMLCASLRSPHLVEDWKPVIRVLARLRDGAGGEFHRGRGTGQHGQFLLEAAQVQFADRGVLALFEKEAAQVLLHHVLADDFVFALCQLESLDVVLAGCLGIGEIELGDALFD